MQGYDFIEEQHRSRLEEGFKLKKMFKEMDRTVEDGSNWYLLPQTWMKKWERYCFFDLIMAEPGSVEEAKAIERDEPGEIDYSSIIEEIDDNDVEWLHEVSEKFSWQNHQLKE